LVSKCSHHCRKEHQAGLKSSESEELLRKDPKRRLDAPDAKAMDTLPRLASLQNLLNQQN